MGFLKAISVSNYTLLVYSTMTDLCVKLAKFTVYSFFARILEIFTIMSKRGHSSPPLSMRGTLQVFCGCLKPDSSAPRTLCVSLNRHTCDTAHRAQGERAERDTRTGQDSCWPLASLIPGAPRLKSEHRLSALTPTGTCFLAPPTHKPDAFSLLTKHFHALRL